MQHNRIKYWLSVLLCLTALSGIAQNFSHQELELAVESMENYDYASALGHVDNYIIDHASKDEESYSLACIIGGMAAHLIGNYEKSRRLLDEIINLPKLPDSIQIQVSCYQLANYMELSLQNECLPIVNDLSNLFKRTNSIDILYSLVNYYYRNHKYNNVLEYETSITDVTLALNPQSLSEAALTSQLHGLFTILADVYSEKNDWDNSLKYWFKSLATLIDDSQDTKALIYTKIAQAYQQIDDWGNALKYQELAMDLPIEVQSRTIPVNEDIQEIIQRIEQNNSQDDHKPMDNQIYDKRFHAIELLNHGIFLIKNERYSEANNDLEKAFSIFEKIDEYDSSIYTAYWLCHVYHALGNNSKYNEVKQMIKKAIDSDAITDCQTKLIILSAYSEIKKQEGETDEAIRIAEMAKANAEKLYGLNNPETFSYYAALFSAYMGKGDLVKSKEVLDEIKSFDLQSRTDKRDYYSAILLESYWLRDSGRLGDMLHLLEKSVPAVENTVSLDIISDLYSGLGYAYSTMGDYQKALLYAEKALLVNQRLYGQHSPHVANGLVNISELYGVVGIPEKALKSIGDAMQIYETMYGKNNAKYISCLQKLAGHYARFDIQKSKEMYSKCLELWESLYGQNSKKYAECLIYSNMDFSINPPEKSISNVGKGLEILKSLGYDNDEFYLSFLHHYCTMLYLNHNYVDLYIASSSLLNSTREYIYCNLLNMPENQRDILWNAVKTNLNGIEQYAASYYNYAVENSDYSLATQFGGLAYDVRLLKKGLLLTSSRNIERQISNLNDTNINNLRHNISISRRKLSSMNFINEDSEQFARDINNYERILLDLLSKHGNFMDFVKIKWQDIQEVLMPGEVAIEFFTYPIHNDVQYGVAYVGSYGDPITITLFTESELHNYHIDETSEYDYLNPKLYDMVWSALNLSPEIKNAHTIYFSADGKINTIAIESLCDSIGKLASEKRNIIRLSSTRELLQKECRQTKSKTFDDQSQVVLYGGLDYDSELPTLCSNGISNSLVAATAVMSTAQRAFKNRAQYLQGTLKEVEALSQLLRSSKTILFTGSEGTEQSVNDVSNKHPHIIHIATHGFYFDECDDASIANSSGGGSNSISIESRAMKESGVLLSGANHKLVGEEVADEHNDGILTGEEISAISLGDVDLVVLSACETGLGAISDEGVFGLQRGLKLSGANCIVMSLWKVNDEATKELMIVFYEGLQCGLSKVEALREAQKKIRETPGFEAPEYWAAFILLDGLY